MRRDAIDMDFGHCCSRHIHHQESTGSNHLMYVRFCTKDRVIMQMQRRSPSRLWCRSTRTAHSGLWPHLIMLRCGGLFGTSHQPHIFASRPVVASKEQMLLKIVSTPTLQPQIRQTAMFRRPCPQGPMKQPISFNNCDIID